MSQAAWKGWKTWSLAELVAQEVVVVAQQGFSEIIM